MPGITRNDIDPGRVIGFMDYNDTTGSIAVPSETWTTIPNNGLGAFTNKSYPPHGVTELMDVSTGEIDPTELELGDVLWYLTQICTELDLTLEEVAEANLVKLFDRLERGKIKGDGDNR